LLQLCRDILFHKDAKVYRLTTGAMKGEVIMQRHNIILSAIFKNFQWKWILLMRRRYMITC